MASNSLSNIGRAIGNGIANAGNYTAAAASRANGVSFAAQAAQGAFNQASADIANAFTMDSLANQYAYNSASAAEANAFTQQMWDKAAAYNTEMFERQMAFNSEQAQINRDFQKEMDSTKYQRAIADMRKAGLNPILAATHGIGTGGASGSSASVSAPQMGSAAGAMASGSAIGGQSASEGNFSGQMEYMGGLLGLISAAIGGFSSAFSNLGSLGDLGQGLGEAIAGAITDKDGNTKSPKNMLKDAFDVDKNKLKNFLVGDTPWTRYIGNKNRNSSNGAHSGN